MHDLNLYDFELPSIDDWFAGDDRTLAFQVVEADGSGVDISGATVTWRLFNRAYESDVADAVLDESDSGVEVVTDNRVDTTVGEFQIRVDGEATDALFGEYWHRPIVEQSDGTEARWRGEVTIEA